MGFRASTRTTLVFSDSLFQCYFVLLLFVFWKLVLKFYLLRFKHYKKKNVVVPSPEVGAVVFSEIFQWHFAKKYFYNRNTLCCIDINVSFCYDAPSTRKQIYSGSSISTTAVFSNSIFQWYSATTFTIEILASVQETVATALKIQDKKCSGSSTRITVVFTDSLFQWHFAKNTARLIIRLV